MRRSLYLSPRNWFNLCSAFSGILYVDRGPPVISLQPIWLLLHVSPWAGLNICFNLLPKCFSILRICFSLLNRCYILASGFSDLSDLYPACCVDYGFIGSMNQYWCLVYCDNSSVRCLSGSGWS